MKKIIIFLTLLFTPLFLSYAYSDNELESANNLAKIGIIKNNQSNPILYELDSSVLRQEIALISRRIAGIRENTSCKKLFSDVNYFVPNSWACKNIEALLENNLISANLNFNPERNISKSEALIMLVKATGFMNFELDESVEKSWQEQIVDFSSKNGIIDKFTDYNTNASRGWIFEIADKLIERHNKVIIVDLHNKFRQELYDINDNPLSWDEQVAEDAQIWAEYLANNMYLKDRNKSPHASKFQKGKHNHYKGEGENIAWGSPDMSFKIAIEEWGKEKQYWNFSNNSCDDGKICGHYTQMIWQKSNRIGCGIAKSNTDYSGIWVVCRYLEPGNSLYQKNGKLYYNDLYEKDPNYIPNITQ